MGGFGTWTYGSIHADRFAAGAAFAGAPTVFWVPGQKDKQAEAVVEGYLPNLYNLPLFVYQSLDDVQVKAPANIKACAELKRLHAEDPGGWAGQDRENGFFQHHTRRSHAAVGAHNV